jgi:hypothetical protein
MDSVTIRQRGSSTGGNCCINAIRVEGKFASILGLGVKASKEREAIGDCISIEVHLDDSDDERI